MDASAANGPSRKGKNSKIMEKDRISKEKKQRKKKKKKGKVLWKNA